jgi:putative phosphoesterase
MSIAMRVAALYDIHGNLPALEAVLAEARALGVDRVVVGGDVLPGPMPRETLARLLDLDVAVQFIQGNGEREALAELAGTGAGTLPPAVRDVARWSARQLPPDERRRVAGWPATLRFEVDGLGAVLFCHATPRSDSEIFTRTTAEHRLLPVFGGLDVPLVVCGHTHMQFDRRVGPVRVVNAGSVGMPFGEPRPGAYWLLLGPDVELRHTPYDLARAAERVRGTSYPQAEEFAVRYVLEPPAEKETLELYARAELR